MKAGEADYAVFDDIQGGMKFFPSYKNWIGAQYQFQVKVMYKDPITIQWGKPCILISNDDPRDQVTASEVDWLEGNCSFIEIQTPLF